MKQLARVTLYVAHNELRPTEPWHPATTIELLTDLLEESYEYDLDILHAESFECRMKVDGALDEDMHRRRREAEARDLEAREARKAELLANDPNVYKP